MHTLFRKIEDPLIGGETEHNLRHPREHDLQTRGIHHFHGGVRFSQKWNAPSTGGKTEQLRYIYDR